jgi:hypothetical protein
VEKLFLAVQHPAILFALLAFPMICVNNSKLLHRVMTDPFRTFLGRTLPVALAISILAALFHSWSYAMSAVILAPYIQWIGLYGLYQRFMRAHGRPLAFLKNSLLSAVRRATTSFELCLA